MDRIENNFLKKIENININNNLFYSEINEIQGFIVVYFQIDK